MRSFEGFVESTTLTSVHGGVVSDPRKWVKSGFKGRRSYGDVSKVSVVVAAPVARTLQYFSNCWGKGTGG